MTPVSKAIWFIESHLEDNLTLEAIATIACVSRHHLARAFVTATGYPVMRYVRSRRLHLAAKTLADGAPNILDVALSAGYNSHEAFTRAFHEHLGLTPEAVREQGHLNNLNLMEAITMNTQQFKSVPSPRIVQSNRKRIAGLVERYDQSTTTQIPSQWGQFNASFAPFNGLISNDGYGVLYDGDDEGNYAYMAGVPVTDSADLPDSYEAVEIPARQYMVFEHKEHISSIQQTWASIWNKALPESDYEVTTDPTFERYGADFDPQTGNGGVELWIPVDKKS